MTIHIRKKDPKTYVVLGCHQGGTSIIAKSLHDQGIKMGVTEEGVFEDIDFVNLNNRILSNAGGSWSQPPPMDRVVATAPKDQIKRLVDRKKSDFWGFKDPRTASVADAYLPYLEDDVYLVCVIRKPKKVAESIERVGHLPKSRAIHLVNDYYERILKTIRKFIDENNDIDS